ncbi:MAG TPA: hypothetical protein VJ749_16035 [Pyrinomonadaceae bacterium]|nr:hypothetical protein [Pyrinomonadaceae bacterium]
MLASLVALLLYARRPFTKPPANSLLLANADPFETGPGATAGQSHQLSRISLQPQALNLARRLGKRFVGLASGRSLLRGSIITGAETRDVRISRWSTEAGEAVEVSLDGPHGPLNWMAHGGIVTPLPGASAADGEVVERLLADSPDRFVLAQLEGASYSTIARNVRPATASEGEEAPLWEVVRVDDPQPDKTGNAGSRWRLYYLNVRTGLIDRVVSQWRGETVEARFLDWTSYSGELVPARIMWDQAGHTLMEFRLTSFLHAQ